MLRSSEIKPPFVDLCHLTQVIFFQTFFRLVAALFRANFFGKGWREVPAGVFRVSGLLHTRTMRVEDVFMTFSGKKVVHP